MHVLGNRRHCGIHLHHPSLLTLFFIRLCDEDDIALVMFSILIPRSMDDMSVVTSWIMHLVHSFSSLLVMIPRLPVFVSVICSHSLSISSCKWWRGRWWKLLIRRIHSISFLKPSALPCCVIGWLTRTRRVKLTRWSSIIS